MRIALAAVGSRGDVYPLLALGAALRDHGHEIVACMPDDFEDEVGARGMEFRRGGFDAYALLSDHASAVTGGGLKMLKAQFQLLQQLFDQAFGLLPDSVRDVDFLIGAGLQFAGPSAAQIHGIPYRYVAYTPSLLPSKEHSPGVLPFQLESHWINRALWRWAMPAMMWPIKTVLNRCRAALDLPPVSRVLDHFVSDRVLVAADADLVPIPRDTGFGAVSIGALQIDVEGELPQKLQDFIDAGSPPVYVGFGSMTDPDAAATTRIVLEAVDRIGARAVISAGWAGLGAGPLPENVVRVGSVSHGRLFPQMAAIVHHGGAGTTTTSARSGVAQVIVPHLMDQFHFCSRVTRLGLGPPPVQRTKLRADGLARALSEAIENETIQERCRDLGERLRAADPLKSENVDALLAEVLTC